MQAEHCNWNRLDQNDAEYVLMGKTGRSLNQDGCRR